MIELIVWMFVMTCIALFGGFVWKTRKPKERQTTEAWFRGLLDSFKGDPLFEAEGRILELEELIAKSAPLQWVWESDDDAAKQWELEALSLLQKEQAK